MSTKNNGTDFTSNIHTHARHEYIAYPFLSLFNYIDTLIRLHLTVFTKKNVANNLIELIMCMIGSFVEDCAILPYLTLL